MKLPNTNCTSGALLEMVGTLCHTVIMPSLALMIKIMTPVLVIVPVLTAVVGGTTAVSKENLPGIHTPLQLPIIMPSGLVLVVMQYDMQPWTLNYPIINCKHCHYLRSTAHNVCMYLTKYFVYVCMHVYAYDLYNLHNISTLIPNFNSKLLLQLLLNYLALVVKQCNYNHENKTSRLLNSHT